MKKQFNAALSGKGNYFANYKANFTSNIFSMLMLPLIVVVLFSACKKEQTKAEDNKAQDMTAKAINTESNVVNDYAGVSNQAAWELQQARAATAKYKQISKAIADGYADISVVVPNMGFHYMKSTLVDATFDVKKPEILVYNKNHDGSFELVAVEYAVPIELTPNIAPQGFTGSADVWDRNTGFGLWLLHAWVWSYNPDGVFNPTNPLVHLH